MTAFGGPASCPWYQGTGKCNGAAGSCGAAGEPLCQTNEPEGGWEALGDEPTDYDETDTNEHAHRGAKQ